MSREQEGRVEQLSDEEIARICVTNAECVQPSRAIQSLCATIAAQAKTIAGLREASAREPAYPTAAYECGCCGAQWYDGIQSDCGHHKNERAYFKPSPCVAYLKTTPPAAGGS